MTKDIGPDSDFGKAISDLIGAAEKETGKSYGVFACVAIVASDGTLILRNPKNEIPPHSICAAIVSHLLDKNDELGGKPEFMVFGWKDAAKIISSIPNREARKKLSLWLEQAEEGVTVKKTTKKSKKA
jgi:hypothetical protein